MKTLVISLPNEKNYDNIELATALVNRACSFTSEEINIKTNDSSYVNLKSILGVLTLNYSAANSITLQIMGEMEEYTAKSLERTILSIVNKEK